jgi:hypothetical protein
MTNTQISMQTTMNRAKPADDQPTQENKVAHEAAYGRMPAEWARTIATLSAVSGVLLASGQRLLSYQMKLAQDITRDIMADPQGDGLQHSSRRTIAYGAELGGLIYDSNCKIAAIMAQHLADSVHGLTAGEEAALVSAR